MTDRYDHLRIRMHWAGINQSELARRAGVSRSFICEMLQNKKEPSVGRAICIARVLGTTAEALFAHWAAGDETC